MTNSVQTYAVKQGGSLKIYYISETSDVYSSDLVYGLIKCIGNPSEFLCQSIDLMIKIGLKFFQ